MFDDYIQSLVKKFIQDEQQKNAEFSRQVAEINESLKFLMRAIVLRQDEASKVTEIAPETLRRKEREGEIQSFSADGSRHTYYRLADLVNLKPRIRGKVRRRGQK